MEVGGDFLELIEGALFRKHIVEVRTSRFLRRSSNSEEVMTDRQSLVRDPTYSHATQLSNSDLPAVSTLVLLVSSIILLSGVILTSDDGYHR